MGQLHWQKVEMKGKDFRQNRQARQLRVRHYESTQREPADVGQGFNSDPVVRNMDAGL
jgi:hypothetical protein